MRTCLIFPNQLFEAGSSLEADNFILFEDPLFYTQYKFHKQKLVLHRASMQWFKSWLENQGLSVEYYAHFEYQTLKMVFEKMKESGVTQLLIYEPEDYLLDRRLNRYSEEFQIPLTRRSSPLFLLSRQEMTQSFQEKSAFRMANFYKKQRTKFDILMEGNDPVGGKWSFDEDNRKSLPKNIQLPGITPAERDLFVEEACTYVEQHFPENPGIIDSFIYPHTFDSSRVWLQQFLRERFANFGTYEDAISSQGIFLFHSVITPMLNTGLITPAEVIEEVQVFAESNEIPINAYEGFVRQIIGWREYMRGVYHSLGVFQRTNNHFGHKRKLPPSFYSGETGILPIDETIQKLLETGYNHHIERLMVLGNFMLLCEFDPNEIYRWFMEMYIDSYDWVMVPNVYGMTQYSDGGRITTKPYISGSNYVLKMSDFKKGEWCEIWNSLYWRFIHVHQEEFQKNPRMTMMIRLLQKMDPEKLQGHLHRADAFLASLG